MVKSARCPIYDHWLLRSGCSNF